MLLALDLGNTSLSAGVFDGAKLVRRFHVEVADFGTLAAKLREGTTGFLGEIDRVGLASVNPPTVYRVEEALHAVLPSVKVTVVGRDALAAFRRAGEACLVADFGTALTVDVVSSDGDYLGGVIAAGVGMSAKALHAGTALLPEVKCRAVKNVIGKDTVSCIESGLFWGTIAEVEGLVARLRKEVPAARKVLATGGYAEIFAGQCAVIDEVVPELTLEGIRLTLEGDRKR
jgi:type III pantothenate kinase